MKAPKIMEKDMREIMEQSRSCRQAYMRMNITKQTYLKYIEFYNLQELHNQLKNQGMAGISKGKGITGLRGLNRPTGIKRQHKQYSLARILNGLVKSPFSPEVFKNVLLKKSIFLEKCALCGMQEKRVIDDRVPLLLDYIDGNRRNGKLNNIRLLCYNCYFFNVGDIIPSTVLFYRKKRIMLTEGSFDDGWIDMDSVVNEDEVDLTKL